MTRRTRTPATMGTRWGRTSCMLSAALGVLGYMAFLAARHVEALDAQLVFQSGTSEISSSGIIGTNVALGIVPTTISNGTTDGSITINALRGGFAGARLNGLCVSHTQSVPGFGDVTILVTAGDGDPNTYETTANNLLIDITSMQATGTNGIRLDGKVQIGVAANSVTTTSTAGVPDDNPLHAPDTAPGYGAGWLGADADYGRMFDVRGTIRDADLAGLANLPGLDIHVTTGDKGCNDGSSPPPIPN